MMGPRDWLDWDRDGRDWPYGSDSHFVKTSGYRWHVQLIGPETAPPFLLIHGTGAASFSWRNMIALLKDHHRLIVPDLPCHGFTRPMASPDLSLEGMTTSLRSLLHHLDIRPQRLLGHSAGSVIAVALANAERTSPSPGSLISGKIERVFSVNGALKPIRGSRVLSPMAKALFANPLSASMFSLLATTTPLGTNLLAATGSRVDDGGEAIYRKLIGSSGHVRGALGMMASWDLAHLNAMLRRLTVPLDLFATEDDPMVPASSSRRAAGLAPASSLKLAPSGGHLAHEIFPQEVADWISAALLQDEMNAASAQRM